MIPSGMSFNMDGTNIYLTMAVLFMAQAMNIDLSWGQQLSLLGVAMLTSKGMAGVRRQLHYARSDAGRRPTVPAAGLALILGVDRFLAEIRTATNFIGNGVAAIVISRWEKELDAERLAAELAGRAEPAPPPVQQAGSVRTTLRTNGLAWRNAMRGILQPPSIVPAGNNRWRPVIVPL